MTMRLELPGVGYKQGNRQMVVTAMEPLALVRMVTKAVLAYRGYQVVEAQDGQEALEKYAADPAAFDLILMDMHMPRLNGYDALQRIRQINIRAKAILLSGGVHDGETGLGDPRSTAFLHKPFDNQELVRLVRQMLDHRQP